MMTFMILVSATWTGLYLAKRITRPVQRLAAGAREIGAGHLDHRIEPRPATSSGPSSKPSTPWPGSSQPASRSSKTAVDLERKNSLESAASTSKRCSSGSPLASSIHPTGHIETINSAALRLLEVDRAVIGVRPGALSTRRSHPLETLMTQARRGGSAPAVQEFALVREGREVHLAAAATQLVRDEAAREARSSCSTT